MSSLDKMWASFIAIGLMLISVLIVTFARTKTKGVAKWLLMFVAFIFLLVSVIYMMLSLF